MISTEDYLIFLAGWQKIVFILVFVAFGLAILNYILFRFKIFTTKTPKEKFDLLSEKETRVLFRSHLFIALAIFFLANTASYETMQIQMTWFFIRLFVAFSIGFLYGYVAHLILKFHHPSKLEKKLKILRYAPRINPENGNEMKLLSEKEEDAYLDEGMQAEENVFSVDYDVWIDPETGYTKIEKYKGHLSAQECDRCGFHTLKLIKEEIIKETTETEDGELMKEYKCSYCGRVQRKKVVLSHKIKKDTDPAVRTDGLLGEDSRVAVVKIEIRSAEGKVKEFDFQNIDQAKHFLEEFNFEKLEEDPA